MITIDEKDDAVIVVTAQGEITLDDIQHYTSVLETIFARKTPCAVVWISVEHAVTSSEARRAQVAWMQQHKALIGESCEGFAWVLKSPAQLLLYKPMLALGGKRMMGCPAAAFGDVDTALRWIEAQLAREQLS